MLVMTVTIAGSRNATRQATFATVDIPAASKVALDLSDKQSQSLKTARRLVALDFQTR